MNFLPEEIDKYAEAHTKKESELLYQLHRETWQKVVNPRMLSGHIQGRVLSMFSKMIRPKRILEIGTYTGYSALCLAEGLTDDGELITIDINDELIPIQKKYFAASSLGNKIKSHSGDAEQILPQLDCNFDLVFLDADKSKYLIYYEYLMTHLPSGAVILIDNVLWSGKVLKPAELDDTETRVLQKLNDLVTQDERVENVLLTIRDGLMIARKK